MPTPDPATKRRNGLIGCGVLIVALLACGWWGNSLPDPPPEPTATPTPIVTDAPTTEPAPTEEPTADVAAEPTGPKPGISSANFERIETGMTEGQVAEIFGSAGKVMSDANIGGTSFRTLVWSRFPGNATITFQGGEVVSKIQAGLP
jgi:hypothetical protein